MFNLFWSLWSNIIFTLYGFCCIILFLLSIVSVVKSDVYSLWSLWSNLMCILYGLCGLILCLLAMVSVVCYYVYSLWFQWSNLMFTLDCLCGFIEKKLLSCYVCVECCWRCREKLTCLQENWEKEATNGAYWTLYLATTGGYDMMFFMCNRELGNVPPSDVGDYV